MEPKEQPQLKAMHALAQVMEAFVLSHPDLVGMQIDSLSLKPTSDEVFINAIDGYCCVGPSGTVTYYNDGKNCDAHNSIDCQ